MWYSTIEPLPSSCVLSFRIGSWVAGPAFADCMVQALLKAAVSTSGLDFGHIPGNVLFLFLISCGFKYTGILCFLKV